ncbi:proteasome assembly chaperone family protein [Candidatus Micrarchaeota archaeon]|nr:proteasome assembly chaperone family protein [Candidatus Micrarchaeota archaeon]
MAKIDVKTVIVERKTVKLRKPVLIEGLPGIGLVGKLAAEHLLRELKAEKIADLYSPHFPHQVLMKKNGTIRMLKNKFYAWKNPKKDGHDLLILIGDVQPITSESQYEVCSVILDYFEKMGGKTMYTLGGYGIGKTSDKSRVFGCATHKEIIAEYKKHGLVFGETNGSIIGAAGLLLGLGKLRGMNGVCLMGETHGGYVDAKSAQHVLEVLAKIIDVKVSMVKLVERAKESEKFMKKMEKEAGKQKQVAEGGAQDEELSYIR